MTDIKKRTRWVGWRALLPPVSLFAILGSLALFLLQGVTPSTVLVAAMFAGLAVAGWYLFRFLTSHLGRATAAAALALLGAIVLGGWALLAPTCPDSNGVGRCTASEVAAWSLTGALVPVAYLLLIGVPMVVGAATARLAVRAGKTIGEKRNTRQE